MVDLTLALPADFLNEEVRNDHVITSQMKQVWAVQLNLLTELLRVCKNHDIKIFACAGTLLGAVRHQGYIPWDDDIDLMLYRKDYDKLCQVASQEFKDPYFFQTEYNDPGSLRGHAQLRDSRTTAILNNDAPGINQGIFIDIFPLDSVVDDDALFAQQSAEANKYRNRAFRLSRWSYRYIPGQTPGVKGKLKALLYPFANAIIRALRLEQKAYKKFELACAKYNHLETEMVSTLSFQFDNRQHFQHRADFEEIVMLPFEFVQIPAGKEYEHTLTTRFGAWHIFQKGGSLHGGVLFDTDKPYTCYLDQ